VWISTNRSAPNGKIHSKTMALRCCAARSSCLLRRSTSSNSSSHKVAARQLHRSKHVAKPEGVGPAAPNAKVPLGAGEQGYTVFAGVMVAAAIGLDAMQDFKLSRDMYRFAADSIALPLLRLLDAEKAHELSVKAASLGLAPSDHSPPLPELQTTVFGLNFPNVVGLAAGFDKNAEAVDGLLDTGFGFVEIGSVTPLPQPGNPKPRMFRLTEDRAVINRCGFNSDGAVAVEERLKRRAAQLQRQQAPAKGLVGINVGKNKWVPEEKAAEDYCAGIRALAKYGDYIVVNVSSPNTPGESACSLRPVS
jgi:Dihydroorotate dehydrogenase